MKQAFIYILKLWLFSGVIAIAASTYIYYRQVRITFNEFGVPYTFLFQTVGQAWAPILAVSVIPWFMLVKPISSVGQSNLILSKKRLSVFLMTMLVTTTVMVIINLFKTTPYFIPGLTLWLIHATGIALGVLVFKLPRNS
jgi:hypothetical protein